MQTDRHNPLRLVASTPTTEEPLAKLEAEAIMRCVETIDRAFSPLPDHSEVRRRWLAAADAAETGARFRWPSVQSRGHRALR